mmetsp:Transcript_10272/g.19707  ORF Transcript_10272/g.19707 Transcript_10272/m.19707 type:complete len:114 (+) Transcript_10272:248-589(+)
MSSLAAPKDDRLADTLKKVESIVGRLRMRSSKESRSSAGASTLVDPSLTLVEKARMLKSRASRIARRVQVDKSDETASTSESLTRSGDNMISPDDPGVTWYKEAMSFDDYGEI